jgi:hypothetical protein
MARKTWITANDTYRAFQFLSSDDQGYILRAAERGARATPGTDVRDWIYILAKAGAYLFDEGMASPVPPPPTGVRHPLSGEVK